MRKILFPALCLILISLFACDQKHKENSEWKTLTQDNYSIEYPADWELDTSGKMGLNFMIISEKSSSKDSFRENVSLAVQDLQGKAIDLKKFVEISEAQIKGTATNGNLLESVSLRDNEAEYQKLMYTLDQSSEKLKFEQYCWIKNDKAYVLTFTCEQTEFDNYQKTGEKMLNSFRLKAL